MLLSGFAIGLVVGVFLGLTLPVLIDEFRPRFLSALVCRSESPAKRRRHCGGRLKRYDRGALDHGFLSAILARFKTLVQHRAAAKTLPDYGAVKYRAGTKLDPPWR